MDIYTANLRSDAKISTILVGPRLLGLANLNSAQNRFWATTIIITYLPRIEILYFTWYFKTQDKKFISIYFPLIYLSIDNILRQYYFHAKQSDPKN